MFGIGKTELKILQKQIQKNGFWFVIGGKFIALTRTFVPFIAGYANMRVKHFWIGNAIGALIWAVVMIGAGILFVAYVQIAIKVLQMAIFGGGLAWIGYMWIYKKETLKKYWAEKMEEMEEKAGK